MRALGVGIAHSIDGWMEKLLVLTGLLVILAAAAASPELLPEPQTWTLDRDEAFRWSSRIPLVLEDGLSDELRSVVESFLADTRLSPKAVRASRHKPGDPAVYIGVFGRHVSFDNRRVEGMISSMGEPGPQGYRLRVSNRGIALAGSDAQGVRFGLETLKQLLGPGGRVPYARIQDVPDIRLRGVYAEDPLSAEDLAQLAALRCNTILYASVDFLDLSGTSRRRWTEAFFEARRYGLEPVPVLDLLGNTAPLLRRDGQAAEGRVAADRLILPRTAWVGLSRTNVIATPNSRIEVAVSGIGCVEGVDFEVQPGQTAYPYGTGNPPWSIRRIPGGTIPDGAVVDVRYAYVPENTGVLCPYAKATRDLWRESLENIRDTLAPVAIHAGFERPRRLRADLRCAVRASSDSDAFTQAVGEVYRIANSVNADWRLLFWSEAFLGGVYGGQTAIAGGLGAIPADSTLVVRDGAVADIRPTKETTGFENDLILIAPASAPHSYALLEALAAREQPGTGFLVQWPARESLDAIMNKAWSLKSPQLPWPHALNTYFGSNLWEPNYEESLAAMVEYLNSRFLRGHTPQEESDAFDDALRAVERAMPRDALNAKALRRQFGHLIAYAELEAEFAAKPQDALLTRMIRLVEEVAEDHPGYDEQRTATIVGTVRGQRLFVPAAILFGPLLLPYRDHALSVGASLLPIPAAPRYRDSQGQAQATIDTLSVVAPIYRIDFDAVGAASVLIEEREGDGAFRSVQHVADLSGAGVRAPILIDEPFLSPSLRISVKADGARAALRDVRVFGLKPEPRIIATRAKSAIHIDGELTEETWNALPEAFGFVVRDAARFAESPTTVRVRASRDALLLGAVMHDRRVRTMDTRYAEHDDPLWEGESFEIWIQTSSGAVHRFAINPNGATFDSKSGDVGWDGAWQGMAKVNDDGWSAEIELPLKLFGGLPRTRSRWGINFVRTRVNVVREESAWAAAQRRSAERGASGTLAFAVP